jgi:quercetin dioxygenase-like cupin family protein
MPRLTRRDLAVASLTLAVIFVLPGATSFAPVKPKLELTPSKNAALTSAAFDWEQLTVKPTKVGAVRKVCQGPTPTLDELEIHITTLNKGEAAHAPHAHADEELLIVKDGTVEALVNGAWVKLGAGSIIFQASCIEHAIRNAGETPATYHVIKWNSPGMLRQLAEAKAAAKTATVPAAK